MPELPEVEVLRRSLEPHLVGDSVARIRVRETRLREPVSAATLRRHLAGRSILSLGRRAKYLLVEVDGGKLLVVHLGMSGRLTLAAPDEPAAAHDQVTFLLGSGRELRFRDPRRFGRIVSVAGRDLPEHPLFAHLGAEPLNGDFGGGLLAAAAARRRGPVKSLLMDARVVVGLGNIYASEALFAAGIHPQRSARRISRQRWEELAAAVVGVLERAIAEGGTTLNDFSDGFGNPGYFRVSLAVYGRDGEPCTACGAPIRRLVQAGRSTFYCPRCQR